MIKSAAFISYDDQIFISLNAKKLYRVAYLLDSHRVIYSKTTNIVKLKAQMDKNVRQELG